MKAMSKSELAQAAGVSVDTLMRWLSPHQQHLEALGMRPGMRVLPPKVVIYIVEALCIGV